MLFFRRRDTASTGQSNLSDQERCIHACLFFAFIMLGITIVLFYFAATNKGPNDQRLFYYMGAGICLFLLLLIIFSTIVFLRRSYGDSSSSTRHRDGITSNFDTERSTYANYHQ